jgi:hypothetical protein
MWSDPFLTLRKLKKAKVVRISMSISKIFAHEGPCEILDCDPYMTKSHNVPFSSPVFLIHSLFHEREYS